jgi:tetratricopeptide (TPR) repeat protein
MIGRENTTPQLVERLTEETEGNALFMVEVMRLLAEEAGSLDEISRQTLPVTIFANGIVRLLQRRLQHVPEWALTGLQLAAVMGRKIDRAVLTAAGVTTLDTWLQVCADAAVLEPNEGEWRFQHDRLREAILHELPDQPVLHQQIAIALESIYGEQDQYAADLVLHWGKAGNPEKELKAILRLVKYLAEITGDYVQVDEWIQRALSLSPSPFDQVELLLLAGYNDYMRSQNEEAEAHYQQALSLNPTPTQQAMLLNRMGFTLWQRGQAEEAIAYAKQAYEVASAQNDTLNIAINLNLRGNIEVHRSNYQLAKEFYEQSLQLRREMNQMRGIAESLNNLASSYTYLGDQQKAIVYYTESLELRRALGDQYGTAATLVNLAIVFFIVGDFKMAQQHSESALQPAQNLGDPLMLGYLYQNLGDLAFAQQDLETGIQHLQLALKLSREIQHQFMIGGILARLGFAALAKQNVPLAIDHFNEVIEISRKIDNKMGIVFGMVGLALINLDQQRWEQAYSCLSESTQLADEIQATNLKAMALLAMIGWCPDPIQQAEWLGALSVQLEFGHNLMFKFNQYWEHTRAKLGETAFEEAIQRGKQSEIVSLHPILTTMQWAHQSIQSE